jgi:hypothetical protein
MMSLTGRFNFHKTWRGYLQLDVEEAVESRWGGEKRRWRRATLMDLAEPEMRALIDLRLKPQFMARTLPSTAGQTTDLLLGIFDLEARPIAARPVAGVPPFRDDALQP